VTARPRVLSIPPGAPFLPTLVNSCLDSSLGVPFDRDVRDFSQALIYVPTRRAARALAHAFADALQPRAVVLPRIVPLGDPADLEDRAILSDAPAAGAADLPPAIAPLKRRFLLARLVERWRASEAQLDLHKSGDGFTIGESFADSFALAGDLARLIDEALIEDADWSGLGGVADAVFDAYWGQTRRFLEIAAAAWPAILKQQVATDAFARRNVLLRAEAARLRDRPPDHPVIAAGSTGSVPATAELLSVIARLPGGAVVLPGLDLAMDEADWERVADDDGARGGQPGHPQAALKRLLGRLGVGRADVAEVGARKSALALRAKVASLAALPADATDSWAEQRAAMAAALEDALAGVSVIEAADEREEALAIAVALREVLEWDGERTAALITPDRALAERVATELRRWGVEADDSAGTPLARAPLAALANLILHAVREDLGPAALLALIENPCIDWRGAIAAARAALELAALRGGDAPCGSDGLARSLEAMAGRAGNRHAARPVRRVGSEDIDAARGLADHVVDALRPLLAMAREHGALTVFAERHAAALEALGGERAAAGPDGQAMAAVFDAMIADGGDLRVSFSDYAAIFAGEIQGLVVPPAEPVQGRIKIWGLLEARLLHADRIVLGGLNEGVWPGQPRQDPFLNRAMRQAMGLPLPERRIGQAAHDFAQALGATDVVIARARTVEGSPMVASRFLRRLDAFVGGDEATALRQRAARFLSTARALDDGEPVPAATRPAPRPAAALQPLTLSVTDVATLHRDPYALYSRDVLGLDPLEPLDAGPDAADRGTLIHDALARFAEAASARWPDDPLATLLAIGREAFAPHMQAESVAAFWWPMFEKAAAWFVQHAADRRGMVAEAFAERYGKFLLDLPDGAVFMLRGRGDLIERLADGTLVVTDYKTGQPPGQKEVKIGLQPQLTLMAAMASAGVLEGVPKGAVGEVRYIRIAARSGVTPIVFKPGEPDLRTTALNHVERLRATIAELRSREIGYLSRRKPKSTGDTGPYDHLARVKEWTSSTEG
jgi:ATP-dependent helicase/nuclease subunit B